MVVEGGRKLHESQAPRREDGPGTRRHWNGGILARKEITQQERRQRILKGRKADRSF